MFDAIYSDADVAFDPEAEAVLAEADGTSRQAVAAKEAAKADMVTYDFEGSQARHAAELSRIAEAVPALRIHAGV